MHRTRSSEHDMTSRIGTASQPVRVGAPVPRQELEAALPWKRRNSRKPSCTSALTAMRIIETVARVMSSAAKAGLVRIGFVTSPE